MPNKVVQVAGTMLLSLRVLSVLALGVLALGCGHEPASTQQVRSAASVDLNCDASMIEFVDDKPAVKRVSGCGRTLTYMSKCNATAGGGQDCRWRAVRDDSNDLD
jgi:hypothetical protein